MLEFAHSVELAFLPCIAAAVALGIAWRRVRNPALRKALQITGALLFFIPQPFVIYLGAYSAKLRLYQQALLAVWCFGICALILARRRGKLAATAAAIVMAGAGAYCGWNVVGDYLLERDVLAGTVEGMHVVHHRRSPDSYELVISHQPHAIPLELLVMLRPGEDVEAEIGTASGTILAIRRRP